MAGKIFRAINDIVQKKANGVRPLESVTRSKLIMKGIIPGDWKESSPDDPEVLQKLKQIAQDFQLTGIEF